MNSSRRPLIAGNWKMNAGGFESCTLARSVADAVRSCEGVDVVVAPPFTALAAVSHELSEASSTVHVSSQNMHWEASGAYTGEVSAEMLKQSGATWVILGHSERRQYFAETNETVQRKTASAIKADLKPIVCVGETLQQREAGNALAVVEEQVMAFVHDLATCPGFGVIAYEPVWAIGTGKVASIDDAQEVHAHIRALLAKVSNELANQTRILYGGSVKPDNAEGLLSQPDIDGALVGGASLDANGFSAIVMAAQKLIPNKQEALPADSTLTEEIPE